MEIGLAIMFACILALVGAAYDAHKDLQRIEAKLDILVRAMPIGCPWKS